MEKELSKIEIATYLRDFSKLMESYCYNHNLDAFTLFKKILENESRGNLGTRKYFNDMINVYLFFLLNKKFSFIFFKIYKNLKDF